MFIDIHTHSLILSPKIKKFFNFIIKTDNLEASELINDFENVSAGIHPWYINEAELKQQFQLFRDCIKLPQVKIIGECGLDKVTGSDFILQEEVFIKQIKIAEEYRKPVIVHCVKSFGELSAIKKVIKPKVPLIIHGFNKKPELAMSLIKDNFYLSFGEALLTQSHVQEAFLSSDVSKVFFETDDAEIEISIVYKKAAELLKMNIEVLERKIYENYLEIFI